MFITGEKNNNNEILLVKKKVIMQRIIDIVNAKSCINASLLPKVYEDTYKEKLDYDKLGYKQLKRLIEAIPDIKYSTISEQSKTEQCIIPAANNEVKYPSNINGQNNNTRHYDSKTGNVGPPSLTVATTDTTTTETTVKVATASSNQPFLVHQTDSFGSFYEFATNNNNNTSNNDGKDNNIMSRPSPLSLDGDDETTTDITSCSNSSSSSFDLTIDYMKEHIMTIATPHAKEEFFSIGDITASKSFKEKALLGYCNIKSNNNDEASTTTSNTTPVFLNTHIPFCMVAVGVQGAGKSHTLGSILESCLLLSSGSETTHNNAVVQLQKPMTALVLHYDQSTTSVCEAAGLLTPNHKLFPSFNNNCCVPRSKAVVLVSPTYYKQRKAFYGEYCTVRPLLFKWDTLTADHIKRIMRIMEDDNQLYVASFMSLLRGYQRKCLVPDFSHFMDEVKEVCNIKGQSGPLNQRIALLESMIAESDVNKDIVEESMDLSQAIKSNLNLIIVDLTDPLLSKDEANSLFQVVTEQFRSIPVNGGGGKLLALDEAHKFMDGIKSDGLSEAIVNVARLMRHDGIRLAVSTQSPKALAPELLELVSIAVLHHFHSQDWWTYIRQKLPIDENQKKTLFDNILSLNPGNALVFASRTSFNSQHNNLIQLLVRPRLTADFGSSRTNK